MAGFTKFPYQVSTDQDNVERSEIAFSNGASFPSFVKSNTQINCPHNVAEIVKNSHQKQPSTYLTETERIPKRPIAPPRHADYVNIDDRLRSFARWIRSHPDPLSLSEAGFFYTNQSDLVRCFQCGIGFKDFAEGDDPLLEHVRYSGECAYLTEYLGTARLSAIKNKCQEQEKERAGSINIPQGCRHEELKTYDARLVSFKNWPSHLPQKPETLAEAGLYYIGVEDHVRCFMCDGGLRQWDIDDDPWTEHCRWFPGCAYARQMKGDDFIALVRASAEFSAEEQGNISSDIEGGANGGLLTTMERLTIQSPEIRIVLDEHKNVCLDMGYDVTHFEEAVKDLRNMGTIKPTIEEVLDMIDIIQERRKYQQAATDLEEKGRGNPLEENKRLKSMVTCMKCLKNNVNALFLPCTHHRLCMECSVHINQCPVCERSIKQKIKTYLA